MAPHDLVAPQPVESEVIIETRGLSRVYPGVTALDNVNYRVYRNKVNVLIGENGAGKSTMMKMLAGVETPSSGQIILDGEAVSLQSTHQAEKLGISIIFQELNLFPNMNVMDNIFMANEFFQKGRINEKYQYALAKSLLERLELDVDPYAPLGELGIGQACGCSPSHFMRWFKKMTGQGFTEYLNEQRLNAAADALRSGSCEGKASDSGEG